MAVWLMVWWKFNMQTKLNGCPQIAELTPAIQADKVVVSAFIWARHNLISYMKKPFCLFTNT
jgi:hypothetical protein